MPRPHSTSAIRRLASHSTFAIPLGDVDVWNLVTDAGRLDLTFRPSGTTGFDDLSRDAESMVVLDVPVPVASLADVIRSKEAAGREKDRLVLPVLRQILQETSPPR